MLRLRNYQIDAIDNLLNTVGRQLRSHEGEICIFQSPTGSGKTLMVAEFLRRLAKERSDRQEFSFIWISVRRLHDQSKNKLDQYYENDRLLKCSYFEELENKDQSDTNDTILVNELVNHRADMLISEDKQILYKASILGICDHVFTIDSFLEKATVEHPKLKDYKVLSVKKELFGNLNIRDSFFDPLRQDYPEFEKWFNRKSEEIAYVCRQDNRMLAFLYLKAEPQSEDYSDIEPVFPKKKRLKIGTLKVDYNGFRLGERFLKIAFDNALRMKIDELYVTIFKKRPEQERLIGILEDYGFNHWGQKKSTGELVYVRDFKPFFNLGDPLKTFPYVSAARNIFLVPIKPDYHTDLLPDSILNTESPTNFEENEPFRNAIRKIYITRSLEKGIRRGDTIIFYRTGGYYKSVVTTLGVVEDVKIGIKNQEEFVQLCGNRSVFIEEKLIEWWNYNPGLRPFIVSFLYAYSFPKRINMKALIDLKVIADVSSAPRGFERINVDKFKAILGGTETDASIIIN